MKFNRNVYHSLMMISQFGINMLVPIFLCSFIGIEIDKRCGTSFWVIALFFIGAAAGFRNVFRFARKIYERPAETDYSIGLWIGVILASAASVHMWWTLDRSLDMASKDAGKTVGTQYLLRYFLLVVVMALLAASGFANPLLAFLGYMGMKVSAYMQPFTRRISAKVFKI